jgi:solute carrier family 25 (mitochondrial citrate transporter), member 1
MPSLKTCCATRRRVSYRRVNTFWRGMGAGIAEALVIVAPVETVKTKCIELNKAFVEGFRYILKTEGVGGIYQGAFATALKQGSNQGLRFMWFNEFKSYVTDSGRGQPMTPLLGLLGGMSAGCFSTLGNNPFDVVKTRMQGTKASQYCTPASCRVSPASCPDKALSL